MTLIINQKRFMMQQQPKIILSDETLSSRRKISGDRLRHLVQNQRLLLAHARETKASAVPQVQMSIRMPEASYLEFRALCAATRRTNGEMLSELLQLYLAEIAK
jgi:hypothetical protein